MKKIAFIFLFLICSFVYSQETDLYNLETKNNVQSETKENVYNFNYLILLVAIVALVLPVLIFLSSHNLKKEVEQELSSLKSERESLAKEKTQLLGDMNSTINNIKNEGEKSFKKYLTEFEMQITKFEIQYTIKKIKTLLLQNKPNKRDIFAELSSIIENINPNNLYIVNKCKDAFPNDKDIEKLAKKALNNIAEQYGNKE